ncbi:Asp-tRNA(Asn)/Glu-tRNA(Gln) amidotransferase subunit GatC [Deinococcus hopiensis]|uniref:Aspartyl/glutamyl-tRNA(Asn/Gln) amidotransferase subunit C n=1 Tax=Deinococcus hopiensis KR-140 TaxID=695939 RepID=A0A1W1VET9_9DEIO|nr:Asp-tRNA(Asn)/Glu-tRNA(Gln) amidotransferase subunit GatC [Deinococcus hopiensis]SMB91730.1 aspartyl/glutamyl-tRNA(Asn/Gln) amidotransferase subunit C [Deinococcus hopiensis KR-140]
METAPVHPTISEAEVQHLAHLARLQLTPEERETMREDLSSILGYFQQLSAVETGGLEEMQRPVALVNVLRDDQPSQPFPPEVLAALAPEMQDGFVKVPRTVEAD